MPASGESEPALPSPADMNDDDLVDELVDTVRLGRNHGTWDRERLRSVSAEVARRGLLEGKLSR